MITQKECPREVLVVDDDSDIRSVLCDILEQEGFIVRTASHGRDALAVLQDADSPPCLIFLDLMMPIMNGWEVVETLKEHPAWRSIPIIALTAASVDADELKHCKMVLRKPPTVDSLVNLAVEHC